jgi:hypothetical protein
MRLAGPTIATPELSPAEAIELFGPLGLDGIDFLCDDPAVSRGVTVGLDRAGQRELRQAIVTVDVKDIDFGGPGGATRVRLLGEGIVPWPRTVPALAANGYDGLLSIENERRWHPDALPEARIGLTRESIYLKGLCQAR